MFRKGLLLGVVISLICLGGNAFGKIAIVSGSTVNIRNGPGTNYKVITQVHRGDELEVIDKKGKWYQVRLSDGAKGWIYGGLILIKEDEQRSTPVDYAKTNFLDYYARVYTNGKLVFLVQDAQGNWIPNEVTSQNLSQYFGALASLWAMDEVKAILNDSKLITIVGGQTNIEKAKAGLLSYYARIYKDGKFTLSEEIPSVDAAQYFKNLKTIYYLPNIHKVLESAQTEAKVKLIHNLLYFVADRMYKKDGKWYISRQSTGKKVGLELDEGFGALMQSQYIGRKIEEVQTEAEVDVFINLLYLLADRMYKKDGEFFIKRNP